MMLSLLAALSLTAPQNPQAPESQSRREFQEVLEHCVWMKREIQSRLLEASPEVRARNAELLDQEGTGAVQLIDRRFQSEAPGKAILKRGGGAYYSFATRSHSYDSEPDLELQNGRWSSGFYGLSFGAVYRVGEIDLGSIDASGLTLPAGITQTAAEAWPVLWSPIDLERAENREHQRYPFWRHTEEVDAVGSTYVLRSWLHAEHDILVAFRVEAIGPYGVTIVWRELKSFPMLRESASMARDQHSELPEAPPEFGEILRTLSLEELFEKLDAEIESADLLSVPESTKERFLQTVGEWTRPADRHGFLRLFDRRKAAGVFGDNTACYFSFANGEHGWNRRPEIGLEQGRLNGGYHQGCWAVDLGVLSKQEAGAAMSGTRPPSLEGSLARAWDAIRETELVTNARREFEPDEAGAAKLTEAGVISSDPRRRDRVQIREGHSYLLRTAGSEVNLLIVLAAIERDELSATLAWHILESLPGSRNR